MSWEAQQTLWGSATWYHKDLAQYKTAPAAFKYTWIRGLPEWTVFPTIFGSIPGVGSLGPTKDASQSFLSFGRCVVLLVRDPVRDVRETLLSFPVILCKNSLRYSESFQVEGLLEVCESLPRHGFFLGTFSKGPCQDLDNFLAIFPQDLAQIWIISGQFFNRIWHRSG